MVMSSRFVFLQERWERSGDAERQAARSGAESSLSRVRDSGGRSHRWTRRIRDGIRAGRLWRRVRRHLRHEPSGRQRPGRRLFTDQKVSLVSLIMMETQRAGINFCFPAGRSRYRRYWEKQTRRTRRMRMKTVKRKMLQRYGDHLIVF